MDVNPGGEEAIPMVSYHGNRQNCRVLCGGLTPNTSLPPYGSREIGECDWTKRFSGLFSAINVAIECAVLPVK
jgi:hypothetical protein